MAKRASSTPLYEVMSSRPETGGRRIDEAAVGRADLPASGTDLIIGRSVRVPIGYLLLAVAGVVLLLLAAYMVGAWRGREGLRAEQDQRFLDSADAADSEWRAADPLGGTSAPPPEARAEPPDRSGSSPGSRPGGRSEPRPAAVEGWPPVDSDPVESGLYYFVLVETRSEGATRLAEFCRERGLEAYVVNGNNARLRRVIVRPGFPTSSRSEPSAKHLEDEIHRIGRLWKDRYPGESDLRDAYLAQP